jgi:hypothetical protein
VLFVEQHDTVAGRSKYRRLSGSRLHHRAAVKEHRGFAAYFADPRILIAVADALSNLESYGSMGGYQPSIHLTDLDLGSAPEPERD